MCDNIKFEEAYKGFESVKDFTKEYNANKPDDKQLSEEQIGSMIGFADVECCVCHEVIKTVPSENGMTSHGFHDSCFDEFYGKELSEEIRSRIKAKLVGN